MALGRVATAPEPDCSLRDCLAGAALTAKRGEQSASELVGAAQEMYLSEEQLEALASTRRKGKPEYVSNRS